MIHLFDTRRDIATFTEGGLVFLCLRARVARDTTRAVATLTHTASPAYKYTTSTYAIPVNFDSERS